MNLNNFDTISQSDTYKKSRVLYIIEAALEYFISLMITGAFLAKVTASIGMSDSLTGILTAFVSLGCGFQLFALLLVNKRPVKRWVTVCHFINQLCFSFIWLIPVFSLSKEAKIAVFVVVLLIGYIISNVINSPKINWYMELVPDEHKGVFTANKEIVSLIGGMIFSLCAGLVIDRFESVGQTNNMFIVGAITLFVLTLFHTITLIFSKEKPTENSSEKHNIREIIKSKRVKKIIILAVILNVALYVSTPFYGSYQINELAFSMTFVSVLGIAYAIVRALFSRPLGKIADKTSFVVMLNISYAVAFCAFAINVFTVPSNGKIMYSIYYVLYAVATAGIGNGTLNLIYKEVQPSQRMGAFALQQSIAGICGFLATTAVGYLVSYIQKNGNTLFGISLYAQQVVSLLSAVLIVIAIVYLNCAIKKKE